MNSATAAQRICYARASLVCSLGGPDARAAVDSGRGRSEVDFRYSDWTTRTANPENTNISRDAAAFQHQIADIGTRKAPVASRAGLLIATSDHGPLAARLLQ